MNLETDASFRAAVEPFRGALRVHCYRMLGSSHDGDDVVQETMLRAWRARASLVDLARLRPWLYRIATNVCLDELKSRPKRILSVDYGPATQDANAPLPPPIQKPIWLEPMPGSWLSFEAEPDPAARYTMKESVALAFVAVLQCLTALQRATLLLRDVVGLTAEETAEALSTSVSAANSALLRARSAIEGKLAGPDTTSLAETQGDVDEELLARYIRSFEEGNLDALVAVLHSDIRTSMPPIPVWLDGLRANEAFYRRMFSTMRPGRIRLLRTTANGQVAFGFYRPATEGAARTLHAIQIVVTRERRLWRLHHFMDRLIFPAFGLPREA
jgi:RNA polymerase sigma-70 factor (ECF subfamily)